MNFDEISNPWSVYRLPNGREMRIRHVLMDVTCTGTGPDGNPNYHLNYAPPIVWIEPTEVQRAVQMTEPAPKGALQ